MPPVHRALLELDLAAFCGGSPDADALEDRIRTLLVTGTSRPEWCWAALVGDQVVARQVWWARPGGAAPVGLDLVTTTDPSSAHSLLVTVRDQIGVRHAVCELHAPIGDPAGPSGPSGANRYDVEVLEEAGFHFEVARVSVQWGEDAGILPAPSRLSFQPAATLDDATLIALFRAVADGSLDHGMAEDRAQLGPEGEATSRLARARGYRAENGWFRVARDRAGNLVGYVVPGAAGTTPMIAEIGVAAPERGKRYVDDLLVEGVRVLSSSGASRIVADTDLANAPMRAAFSRCGFTEYRRRDDWAWSRSESGGSA